MPEFCHLHCHTQFSLLDGAASIEGMLDKAKMDGQKAVALTDHGNMFGAFKFVAAAHERDLKPIVGCEFYLVEDRFRKTFLRSKNERDVRYHQLLLAKNRKGYQNLTKLCSLGFMDGLYMGYPRIDKELLAQYTEGVIATSCCIGAEIPQTILKKDFEGAEKKLKWWLDLFGEDYYIELQRHGGLEQIDDTGMSQEDVNQHLLKLAKKYNVKVIATNDSHYVNEEDYSSHDILLCLNTGKKLDDEGRFKFPSSDFYFKTQGEMGQLFHDVPMALDHTMEICDKVESLKLTQDVLLPKFPLPPGFKDQSSYLRHLTYEGAKKRYGEITAIVQERLDFELSVIDQSGYPGYFLIVQDFTTVARQLGVAVGPGRGSAAGSAVAYCLWITNVDPIAYDLLFERFLNPERISMPDIDIDFDDEGRSKVIDYVVDKYGRNQVAQIITYGSMAAKSSIRDVGRVLDVPLSEVDRVAKLFPQNLSASLNKVLAEKDIDPKLKGKLNEEDTERAYKFRKLAEGKDIIGETLRKAKSLEGSIRNTGIHACGVIITPSDIRDYIPVTTAKDSDLLVTQFDNSVVEDAGLLKMDFLGLKTLSIIKYAAELVKKRFGIEIDPDEIPLDDEKTYELFQHGETIGIFQYESTGMRKHMINLKPNKFQDLIAMNALYRPGPMQYIPEYIARKHGHNPITYDLPEMEEFLAETYGITVYQEQVMLLSQKLAGFTKGQADMLRKGMGKKKKKIIDQLFPLFIDGCNERGHPESVAKKIWSDWEAFASYAFNKSHSTCYAIVAFQTAYLKANYPAEFMAAVLTANAKDISKINFFLRECKQMGLKVKGPSVNISEKSFSVNKNGEVQIGLAGLKNVGEAAVEELIQEREQNGQFENPFDLVRRLNTRTFNKKTFESLVYSGSLDEFVEITRSQYFAPSEKYDTFLEYLLKYGHGVQQQKESMATSLFGGMDDDLIPEPKIPEAPPFQKAHKLEKEKEVVGIYVTGHPLDKYKMELDSYTTIGLNKFERARKEGLSLQLAGMITSSQHGVNKKGNGYARFTLQDYNGSVEFFLNKDNYTKFSSLIQNMNVIHINGQFAKKWYGEDIIFKINKIRLLESVAEELTKKIRLSIPVGRVNEDFSRRLQEILHKYPGQHELNINFLDLEKEWKLEFKSRSKNVNISSELIQELESNQIRYKIN